MLNWLKNIWNPQIPTGRLNKFGVPDKPPTKPPKTPLQKKIEDQLEWYQKNKYDDPELNRDYAAMLTNLNK